MTKHLNLLIPLILMLAGIFSCTTQGTVEEKVVLNQEDVATTGQDSIGTAIVTKYSTTSENRNTSSDKELNPIGLAHFNLGILYVENNLIDEAIVEFKNALELNPQHLESHVRLGLAYGLGGMTSEAMSEFDKAMDIDIQETVAKIAIIKILKGNKDNFLEAKIDEEEITRAHINLSNEYKKEGKTEKAKLEYEKALQLKSDRLIAKKSLSRIHYKFGVSCLLEGKYSNAIAKFEKVLETNPNSPQVKDVLAIAHHKLGLDYAENNEPDKAILEFNKTKEIKPDYDDRMAMKILDAIVEDGDLMDFEDIDVAKEGWGQEIANTIVEDGDFIVEEKAQENTTIANNITAKKNNHEEKTGSLQANGGHKIKMIELLKKYNIFARKEKTNKLDQEIAYADKDNISNNNIETPKNNDGRKNTLNDKGLNSIGFAHFNLGIIYVENDLIDQAIEEFGNALEFNPESLEAHVFMGTTYGLKGMTKEAMSEFRKSMEINLQDAVAKILFIKALQEDKDKFPKGKIHKGEIAEAHLNLGNIYKEEGILEKAMLEYKKTLELKPGHLIAKNSVSSIHYEIGISHLLEYKYGNAIAEFNKYLEVSPDSPQIKNFLAVAHYKFGMDYAKSGELDKAMFEFSRTKEINPDYNDEWVKSILEVVDENKRFPEVKNVAIAKADKMDTFIEQNMAAGETVEREPGIWNATHEEVNSLEEKENKEVLLERTTLSFGQIEHPYNFLKYRIAPGDVLDVLYQVRTWTKKEQFEIAVDHTVSIKFVHAPELNETQLVRPDGKISLPYLGQVYVIEKTIEELKEELLNSYSEILQNPEIYVTVPEFQRSIKELKADLHTAPRGLSRLVTVRPDGNTTFPMIGDVFVAEKTIPEVNRLLNHKYEEMLPGLHCDLFLERHSGSVVYVVGEVNAPGAYKIAKPITIIEAITLAGSYKEGAKLSSIIVSRKHTDKIVATKVNLKKVLSLKKGSKYFYLQPDDIVYVPKTFIKRAADVARDLADVFFFRGWGTSVGFSYELHNEPTDSSDRTTPPAD